MAGKSKTLTRDQLQSRKDKAVHFLREVVGDPGRAEEVEAESPEDYAARRKFEVVNPVRRGTMPRKTLEDYRDDIANLKDQIADLEDENETLQERLDDISEIVAPEEEPDDEAEAEADEDLGE